MTYMADPESFYLSIVDIENYKQELKQAWSKTGIRKKRATRDTSRRRKERR